MIATETREVWLRETWGWSLWRWTVSLLDDDTLHHVSALQIGCRCFHARPD